MTLEALRNLLVAKAKVGNYEPAIPVDIALALIDVADAVNDMLADGETKTLAAAVRALDAALAGQEKQA